MTTPTIDCVPDLDSLAQALERKWQEDGEADLRAFLPSPNHAHFDRIGSELACIDIEMRWQNGKAKTLGDYRSEYPQLFQNPDVVGELAFEDYRQRIQAGCPNEPWEYRDHFGVDIGEWPTPSECAASQLGLRTQVIGGRIAADGLAKTTEVRDAIVKALRRSSPREAEQLDSVLSKMPKVGDRTFGFELVRELGEGAFAKVFLAKQSELSDRPVALKVSLNISDEPRKLARLQHTNIVPIYSTHDHEGLHAVCMPYLGSNTLDDLLKNISDRSRALPRSGRDFLSTLFDKQSTTVVEPSRRVAEVQLPASKADASVATPILDMMSRFSHIEAVLWMGARIADGLAHAHERGILHLDLKPANILLTDDGQPMLLDFNLSIDLRQIGAMQMARLGGTLPYMSPEQLDAFSGGKRDIDERSDLYSLGIILFEMMTGSAPFLRRIGRMKDVVEAMQSDRKGPLSAPEKLNSAISPAVAAILRKLLEPDRSNRYRSAAQLREDLERQLADLPLKHAPDRHVPERFRKWKRRHPRAAVACLVSAIAFAFFLLPATVLAVRQNQIAERKRQIEAAEARELWRNSAAEARTVQVLLATQSGERAILDEGIDRGKAVLEAYRIGSDSNWQMRPAVASLSEEDRERVRVELGEMLLFMARGEEIRARDASEREARESGFRIALRWNELASECYPVDRKPRKLFEQFRELLPLLPGAAKPNALPARPDDSDVEFDSYHDGLKLATEGRYREALALLIPFAEAHPRHYQSWFARGICHDRVGESGDAAACWTACIALEPDLPHAHFNRGLGRLRDKDFVRANRDFSRALELKPSWTDASMNRAIARKGMKDYAGSTEDLRAIVAKPNTSVRARFLLAEIASLSGKAEEAKAIRTAALKIQPDDELGWSTRGYTRMNDEPSAALEDFERAIALNPRSREALINKSIVLSEYLNRARESLATFDRFLEYYPDDIGMRMGRGVVLARLGECARARRDAEASLKYDRSPFFLFQAAGLFAQISQHERGGDAKSEALTLLASALRKGFSDLDLFRTDSDLNPIRGEVEFKRLLEIAAGLKK